jgi:small GTP-binding protein
MDAGDGPFGKRSDAMTAGEGSDRTEGQGAGGRFHVVVLGTGPVGKTALVNALLGRSAGETGATSGTTARGQTHTHAVEGMEGTLLLTDTPGMGEAGVEGTAREAEAVELAMHADLLVFLVDQDLVRADYRTIGEMSREGKRLIVALNKKDRLTEDDREAILAKLRERLAGLVPHEDVVAVAADPSPVTVRVRKPDGTTETALEEEPPDLEALEARVAEILRREGDALRAGNLLLRARRLERAERARVARERRQKAMTIIERHQWVAAVTAFANPVLVLGPMAAGAVQLRMLSEIAAVYDVPLSAEYIEQVGRQMAQTLFKLGIAEVAAGVLGGLLKFNPVGFMAGGVIQAVTMAYLTRLTGASFLEYVEHGQTWGEGGMQAALTRQLEATRQTDWLLHFAEAVLRRLLRK